MGDAMMRRRRAPEVYGIDAMASGYYDSAGMYGQQVQEQGAGYGHAQGGLSIQTSSLPPHHQHQQQHQQHLEQESHYAQGHGHGHGHGHDAQRPGTGHSEFSPLSPLSPASPVGRSSSGSSGGGGGGGPTAVYYDAMGNYNQGRRGWT